MKERILRVLLLLVALPTHLILNSTFEFLLSFFLGKKEGKNTVIITTTTTKPTRHFLLLLPNFNLNPLSVFEEELTHNVQSKNKFVFDFLLSSFSLSSLRGGCFFCYNKQPQPPPRYLTLPFHFFPLTS